MQRINLLYVITKLELGGAQLQAIKLIRSLDKACFMPFIFTAQDGILLSDVLGLEGVRLKKSRFLKRDIHLLNDLCAFFELYRFIKKNKIAIVHTHSSKAGILGRLAARFAGVKIIVHSVHGWSFNDRQPYFMRKASVALERYTARFTDALIVVSQHDLDRGLLQRIGTAKQYVLIRYGIDVQEFLDRSPCAREEFGIEAADCLVTNISCFKPQKACLDYIRLVELVAKRIAGVKFILVGDGVMRPEIQEAIQAKQLGKIVKLTGWRRDIPEILAASDIFVLTSLWEGLPIVVLEAMASGLPVVATDTGGIREVVIDGKTGFLVTPGDISALVARIIFLIENRQARLDMGRAARESLSSTYAQEKMQDAVSGLYKGLLKQEAG